MQQTYITEAFECPKSVASTLLTLFFLVMVRYIGASSAHGKLLTRCGGKPTSELGTIWWVAFAAVMALNVLIYERRQ